MGSPKVSLPTIMTLMRGLFLWCFLVDAGYGLGRSLGDCRPALPKGQKYEMFKTQTVPRQEANSLNKPMAYLGFLFLCVLLGDGQNLSHRPWGILRSSLAVGQPGGAFGQKIDFCILLPTNTIGIITNQFSLQFLAVIDVFLICLFVCFFRRGSLFKYSLFCGGRFSALPLQVHSRRLLVGRCHNDHGRLR